MLIPQILGVTLVCAALVVVRAKSRSRAARGQSDTVEPEWPWPLYEVVADAANSAACEKPEDLHPSAAQPLQQVTIRLQGSRESDYQAVIGQLANVLWILRRGERSGADHDDDFGYAFKVEAASNGPSFFDGAPGGH
jgi:hypothetical protein